MSPCWADQRRGHDRTTEHTGQDCATHAAEGIGADGRAGGTTIAGAWDTGRVGYNPYRKFKARPSDYVMVVAAVTIAVALVVWGMFG